MDRALADGTAVLAHRADGAQTAGFWDGITRADVKSACILFAELDNDRDGFVRLPDLIDLQMRDGFKLLRLRGPALLALCDVDADGRLNVVEFVLLLHAVAHAGGSTGDAALPPKPTIDDARAVAERVSEFNMTESIDDAGDTPLHHYAARGLDQLTAELLGSHVNPNVANKAGATPLHVAAALLNLNAERAVAVVAALLGAGADVNAMDASGRTPLDVAVHGAVRDALSAAGGKAPVTDAAAAAAAAMKILERDARNARAATMWAERTRLAPLLVAAVKAHDVDSVKALLKRGADPQLAVDDNEVSAPLRADCSVRVCSCSAATVAQRCLSGGE